MTDNIHCLLHSVWARSRSMTKLDVGKSANVEEKADVESDNLVQISVQPQYVPLTNQTIKIAVKKLCSGNSLEKEEVIEIHGRIKDWDTSQVTDMSYLFSYQPTFNENISGWDVSNVNDMNGMFMCASAFNIDISNWKIKTGADLSCMFFGAVNFDINLSKWNVVDAKTTCMFAYADKLNYETVEKWGNFHARSLGRLFNK